jgi:DNA-binding transcriptional LysR family regulator
MGTRKTRSVPLDDVAVFVRVVEEGSFTAAGRALRRPKSSVSRSVARLEEALGARLLQRTTRALTPTEAGREYWPRARAAMAALDEAAEEVARSGGEPRGLVRMTAPDDGADLLAGMLLRFSRRYPRIHVDVSLTGRHVDLVAEGLDLAVRAGELADSSLVARRVGVTSVGLFAAPSYLRRRGTPRTLADLARHDCVVQLARGGSATWSFVGPEGRVSVEVRGQLAADQLSFRRQAVLLGAGLGMMPHFLAAPAVRAGQLVHVLPQYALRGAPVHVVVPSRQMLPARVALLRDFLVEELGRVPWDQSPSIHGEGSGEGAGQGDRAGRRAVHRRGRTRAR